MVGSPAPLTSHSLAGFPTSAFSATIGPLSAWRNRPTEPGWVKMMVASAVRTRRAEVLLNTRNGVGVVIDVTPAQRAARRTTSTRVPRTDFDGPYQHQHGPTSESAPEQ